VRQPPTFDPRKMKKITVRVTCFRSRFVWRSGRMRSIDASVVPIKDARSAPPARKAAFVRGVPGRSPSRKTPPEIT
jgi:hypothetical protein